MQLTAVNHAVVPRLVITNANTNPSIGLGIGGGPSFGVKVGLTTVLSNADLDKRDEYQRAIESPGEQEADIISIVGHVRTSFERASSHREEQIEQRMLDALQRRLGTYPDEKLSMIKKSGGSDIYVKLTEVKCRAAEAWLVDIFAPADGKPWSLDPTPVPDLAIDQKQQLAQAVWTEAMKMQQAGQMQVDESTVIAMAKDARENMLAEINGEAKRKADAMERKIDDQFREGCFDDAWKAGLVDLTTLGTMIVKGPYAVNKRRLKWEGSNPVVTMTPVETYSWISVWDAFPAPNATTCQDGDYFIERCRWSYSDLSGYRGATGFMEEAIRGVLSEYRKGRREYVAVDDSVRQLGEKPDAGSVQEDGNIEGLIYHGDIPGKCLTEIGVENTPEGEPIDEEESYSVDAWVIGSYCVRCVFNADPLKQRPYSKTTWADIPGSFWGRGIPEMMSDVQDVCNATCRAIVNNMAIASGPQVVINDVNRIADGEDITQMYPWRIWQFRNDGLSQASPVEFFQPNSNVEQLWSLYERFLQQADDRTVPAYSYGSDRVAGAGQTASGLSMLLTAASRVVKLVISKMDKNVFKECIQRQYDRNMLYDPDEDIKGDVQIVARGALGMFVKDQQLARMKEFMEIAASPVYAPLLGEAKLIEMLREHARQLQLPPGLVPSKEEMKARLQQQAAQQMQLTAGNEQVGVPQQQEAQ